MEKKGKTTSIKIEKGSSKKSQENPAPNVATSSEAPPPLQSQSSVSNMFNLYRRVSQSGLQSQSVALPAAVYAEVLEILGKVQFFENVSTEFRQFLIPKLTPTFYEQNTWIISFLSLFLLNFCS